MFSLGGRLLMRTPGIEIWQEWWEKTVNLLITLFSVISSFHRWCISKISFSVPLYLIIKLK